MLFIGGPWHAREEDVPDQPWVAMGTDGSKHVYTPQTFAAPGIGHKRIMVHPVFLNTPNAAREAIKDALLERWLRS